MPIIGIVAAFEETLIAPLPPDAAVFIAVGTSDAQSDPIVMTSVDGVTWVNRTSGAAAVASNSILNDVACNGTRWVAVGYDSGGSSAPTVITSDDNGATWTARTASPSSDFIIRGICWTGSSFIAVGSNGAGNTPRVMTSADGATWTARTSAPTTGLMWKAVSGYSGLAVAVGGVGEFSSPSKIMTSANEGASWTARTAPGADFLQDVCASSGFSLVAVGFDVSTNRIASSSDGITWSNVTPPSGQSYYGVAFNGTRFVAVGMDDSSNLEARIATSPASPVTTWTTRTPDPTGDNGGDGINLLAVASHATAGFIAVGRDNSPFNTPFIMHSADGITWTARTPAPSSNAMLFGVGANPT